MGSDILVIEGQRSNTLSCKSILEERGYLVDSVSTRRNALDQLGKTSPDLVIVDSRFLRFDALRFCRALRENENQVPLLFVCPERVSRVDSGATVILHGTFTARKLLNRVKRLLSEPGAEILRVGDVTLDLKQQTATRGKTRSRLTPRQARLLEVFMRNAGRVLTRRFLMKEVWNTDFVDDTRTLEVHVHWLRKAIEKNPSHPVYLITIRRLGYRFDVPPSE